MDNCDIVANVPDPLFSECLELSCSIVTEADCLAAGGAYQGDDTGCSILADVTDSFGATPALPIPDNDPRACAPRS